MAIHLFKDPLREGDFLSACLGKRAQSRMPSTPRYWAPPTYSGLGISYPPFFLRRSRAAFLVPRAHTRYNAFLGECLGRDAACQPRGGGRRNCRERERERTAEEELRAAARLTDRRSGAEIYYRCIQID